MVTPTKEQIDAAAKAAYFEMNSIMHDHDECWIKCGQQGIYRDVARAALLAADRVTSDRRREKYAHCGS